MVEKHFARRHKLSKICFSYCKLIIHGTCSNRSMKRVGCKSKSSCNLLYLYLNVLRPVPCTQNRFSCSHSCVPTSRYISMAQTCLFLIHTLNTQHWCASTIRTRNGAFLTECSSAHETF